MPVVRPYPIGEVQSQPLPNAAPSVAAAGEASLFGGNQARDLQQAGANLDKASDSLATIELREQALQDEADAKAADAGLANDVRTLLFDPEKGYYAKRGKEAIDGATGVLQALDQLKEKYNGGLKTEAARRLYGGVADRRITGLQTQIGDKVITERRTYSDQASAARVQNFVDDAGVNYPDQKKVEQAIAGARSEILSQAEINHEPPEETQRKIRLAESTAITGVVKRLAEDDPYKAKAFRDANAGRLNSADGLLLDKLLKEHLLRRGSQDRANDIREGRSADAREQTGWDENRGSYYGANRMGSGAWGKYQFMPDTWASVAKAHPDLGLPFNLRQATPEQQEAAKKALDEDNAKGLQAKGIQPTAPNLYLAHRFGVAGATTFLQAKPDAKVSDVLPEAWVAQNPDLRNVTVAQFSEGVQRRYGDKAGGQRATGPELDPKTGRPSLQWQLDEAGRITDQDMRDATMQRLRVMHGQDEAVVAEARKKAGEEVQALVMGGKLTDPAQVPVDKWVALDPAQQRAIQVQMDANARGKDNPPNPPLYAELMRQAVDDPEAFKKRDLVPLASQLPHAHWTKFQDLQASMGRKENAEADKQVSMARALHLSDALLRSAGIYLGYADSKGKVTRAKEFDDFKAQFQSALDQEIDRYRVENGKRPDDGELTKMADRLLLQGRFRGTGMFSDDRTVSFLQGKGEGAPQFYVRYGDIPADRRKVVEDQLKAKGLPADKTAVENAYTAWRMQGNR